MARAQKVKRSGPGGSRNRPSPRPRELAPNGLPYRHARLDLTDPELKLVQAVAEEDDSTDGKQLARHWLRWAVVCMAAHRAAALEIPIPADVQAPPVLPGADYRPGPKPRAPQNDTGARKSRRKSEHPPEVCGNGTDGDATEA